MKDERNTVIDLLKKEILGPISENEVLFNDSPFQRYIMGILHPQEEKRDISDAELFIDSDKETTDEPLETINDSNDLEEAINLSNSFQQSAISLTVCVENDSELSITAKCGSYKKTSYSKSASSKDEFERHQISHTFKILANTFSGDKKTKDYEILDSGKGCGLHVFVFLRHKKEKHSLFTISFINTNQSKDKKQKPISKTFFQAELFLFCEQGFKPIPEHIKVCSDEDYQNNQLLYRGVKKYAIGHGCSAEWKEQKEAIKEIHSSFMPSYEARPVIAQKFDDLSFEMLKMDRRSSDSSILQILKSLTNKYLNWINDLINDSEPIKNKYKSIDRNIALCKECCERMNEGIDVLASNPKAMLAFKYMNEAMLLQQLHYNIKKRKWIKNKHILIDDGFVMPDLYDKSTWGEKKDNYGKWRLFQIAFILLNINSIVYPSSQEHSFIELIWFPTGGGKTEAYLGLSAFTIFYKRLTNPNDCGTDILMRYTLRLLTSQQYERASSLICSCDYLRSQNEQDLGKQDISIGMWVGKATSPNTQKQAIDSYTKLKTSGSQNDNPFIIKKCPWCGAEMGPSDDITDTKHRASGYQHDKMKKLFYFACDNPDCHFHDYIPLTIIDEDIYNNSPSLIIGTVDKFAMLPFKPEAQSIFGIKEGIRFKTPSLIIQDELHLISGPLGSMVGLYETMIDYLSTDLKTAIGPKIIASTATISHAREQCKNLYNRSIDQVKIFPPSGINANESFFATIDNDPNHLGRKYVGLCPTETSSATSTVRIVSSILQAPLFFEKENETQKDAYWTNVLYFNALRDLGHALTLVEADIGEYIKIIAARSPSGQKRVVKNYKELTSRIDSNKVQYSLEELTHGLENNPLDICLATNMISVGLDVNRLGLMTVFGQPKTTSEYIQASSRVGRSFDKPGLVFTLYTSTKPRDRSIYENFVHYHSKMYTYVEPTSVTPFSPQLRLRALAAAFFGMLRLTSTTKENNNPDLVLNDTNKINTIVDYIVARASFVDSDEKENTKKQLIEIIDNWKSQRPTNRFAPDFLFTNNYTSDKDIPCFYPDTAIVSDTWKSKSQAVPTSMRNVDKECNAKILDYLGDE